MSRGFTLIELIIVLAIAMMLFGVIGTIASNTYPKNQLRSEADTVVQTIRQAQVLTLARKYDSVWGVHRTGTDLTLFAGSSYEARNQLYDRVHLFPSGVTSSGLIDVVFDGLRGTTTQIGTMTITSQATAESEVITITQSGLVEH